MKINSFNIEYNISKLNIEKVPIIIENSKNKLNNTSSKNLLSNIILQYNNIINNLEKSHFVIPIVLSADNNYAAYLYTTMVSILENGNKNTYYSFYILVPSNFSRNNENIILKLNNKYKCYIYFKYIKKKFENLIMKISHITFPTYYRLLIGDLLPKEINKCIYLDVDICVCKDLTELFNIDMKDNYLAGVISPIYYFYKKKNCERLKLPSMNQYINAGMLLMNLQLIRKDNLIKKFLELSERNYESQDQDILNVACYGKILTLPPKYNVQVKRFIKNNLYLKDLYEEEDINQAKQSPYIIHYSDKKKPWNSIGIFMDKFWWDIAKKTPFINSLFSRKNIYKKELKKFWYRKKKSYLNLERPRTFNEKIQWLKIYDSIPIKTKLTDKYLVREWVSKKIGEEYLIPLLGVYDRFKEIKFKNLPNQFVIKCNHGRNYSIIVKNKTRLNFKKTESKIERWMMENYAFIFGLELQYRDIRPKIIIEKYMNDGSGMLRNFKFSCFNGKPSFIYIDIDISPSEKRRNIYNLEWKQLPYKVNSNYLTFQSPKKPKFLKKMIELASILCMNFTYVIVEFYVIEDKIFFDKMDFTPWSGTEDITPKKFERKLNSLIKIPKLAYNIDTGEYYKN